MKGLYSMKLRKLAAVLAIASTLVFTACEGEDKGDFNWAAGLAQSTFVW